MEVVANKQGVSNAAQQRGIKIQIICGFHC